jgi:hypothetical protein
MEKDGLGVVRSFPTEFQSARVDCIAFWQIPGILCVSCSAVERAASVQRIEAVLTRPVPSELHVSSTVGYAPAVHFTRRCSESYLAGEASKSTSTACIRVYAICSIPEGEGNEKQLD